MALYNAFSSKGWWTTHISAFETPNLQGRGIVIPGLITVQDIEDARRIGAKGHFSGRLVSWDAFLIRWKIP